ncbi:STAS domain-containing protein [Acidovorax citrulli]|nr:STAS domain-containing protein [Paracidovorax citrulli]
MLVLPTELTHRQAEACLRMLLQGLKAHRDEILVVDAAPLASFDSSALAVLLECRRAALLENRRFEVKDLPAGLAKLAGLYGVGGVACRSGGGRGGGLSRSRLSAKRPNAPATGPGSSAASPTG